MCWVWRARELLRARPGRRNFMRDVLAQPPADSAASNGERRHMMRARICRLQLSQNARRAIASSWNHVWVCPRLSALSRRFPHHHHRQPQQQHHQHHRRQPHNNHHHRRQPHNNHPHHPYPLLNQTFTSLGPSKASLVSYIQHTQYIYTYTHRYIYIYMRHRSSSVAL